MIIVHGFPPLNDRVCSPSPFCAKLETWLRMAGIPYKARGDYRPDKAPKGKAPWVTLEDGRPLSDSALIIAELSRRPGAWLEERLAPEERAKLVLVQRTLEDHLYWCVVSDRWQREEGFAILKPAYFGRFKPPLSWIVPWVARRKALQQLQGQGLGRHDMETLYRKAEEDLDGLEAALGQAPFFGGERPVTVDATAYGLTSNLLWGPFPGRLQEAVRARTALLAHAERVHAQYWAAR
jgi:glutathione S-transferase